MNPKPQWRFLEMQPGEMNVDPIKGEFFTTEAVAAKLDLLNRFNKSFQNRCYPGPIAMELRKLTDKGIEEFRLYLHQLKQGSTAEPPIEFLTDPEFSQALRNGAPIDQRRFASQLDLTYDLYSMSGAEIVGLLPAEFNHWLDRQMKLRTQV
jgi:hypothetical protein